MRPIFRIGLIILAVISVVFDFLGDSGGVPGFYILFAAAGALFFIFFAKYFLKKLLMREEDYYDS